MKPCSSFFGKALFALALLSLVVPMPTHAGAQANRSSAADKDRNGPPDPCEQALTAKGKAKGLHERCGISSGGGAARGDFNGDMIADLVIGVPYEDGNGVNAVGSINVLYGSADGLTTVDQVFDMTTFGYTYQSKSHFGLALAAGNFNVDTYSDLAIGMPDYDGGCGRVLLIDGSANGLDASTARTLPDLAPCGRTGLALVWADFNGDTVGDLAVGSPNDPANGDGLFCVGGRVSQAGTVRVYYGGATGLTTFGLQLFQQGGCRSRGGEIRIGDSPEQDDHFGYSLAAGNFDGDAFADLVIGVPFEDLALFDKQDAGLIHVLKGSVDGLASRGSSQIISQDTEHRLANGSTFTVAGVAESGDLFGSVFATLRRASGHDDLFAGIPFEDVGTTVDAGAVQFFKGGYNSTLPGGVIDTGSTDVIFDQGDLAGVAVEEGDLMGWALAVGDFDGDGAPDLAIGVPEEDTNSNTIADAGLVTVLYNPFIATGRHIGFTRMEHWTQDTNRPDPVPGSNEPGDHFGYALSSWNYGRGTESDLAIGIPFKNIRSASTGTFQANAGAVIVLYGSGSGLTSTGADFWHQDRDGIMGVAEPGDRFGNRLY